MPVLVKRPSGVSRVEVIAGGDSFYLELLEDMGAVMEETFRARYNNIFLKTYIRTIIKYTAAAIAVAEISKNTNTTAALASAILAKAAIDASESADIRMSRYLPDKAYIGGINLEPGIYNVKVNFYQGGSILASAEYNDVSLNETGLNLIEAVSLK
jgi:ribosomal protein S20